MQTIPNNEIRISILNRREALQQLRDLGILGLGGLLGLQQGIRQKNVAIESLQDFIPYSTHTKINPLFSSNIPQEILSLPLKHFSIPHEYASILQSYKKQERNVNFIIPLVSDKYLDSTHYYLNMPMPHKNLPFLSYHYDSLQSLLKDLEFQGFSMRNYTMNSINIQILKELFMLLKQDEWNQRLYKHRESRNPHNKDNDTKAPTSAIDAYHTAMNYLDDVYNDCFNTNLKDNIINLQKHREFLRALNIIGENNIKALYVGINQKRMQKEGERINRDVISEDNEFDNDELQQQKRPKFIGRLATTIIIEDGLWLG